MYLYLFALLTPFLHAIANIIDDYFSNKVFKSDLALDFYACLLNLIFVPLIFIIEMPAWPTIQALPFLILIGLIEMLYLIPYYQALKYEDTSIVSSLFELGKIFVPIFAFVLLGEKLSLIQYFGFIIIILASSALTFKKLKPNKAFLLMLITGLLLSIQAILYKFLSDQTSWSTIATFSTIFAFLFSLGTLINPNTRHQVKASLKPALKNSKIFILEGICTFLGTVVSIYVISKLPLTVEKSIESSQPLFILLISIILKSKFKNIFKEHLRKKDIIKKLSLFSVIFIGILLVSNH